MNTRETRQPVATSPTRSLEGAVAPGSIQTERLALPDEQRERSARAAPVQRIGRLEEVAVAVVWLCSDQASFITGATILIDDGKLAAGA